MGLPHPRAFDGADGDLTEAPRSDRGSLGTPHRSDPAGPHPRDRPAASHSLFSRFRAGEPLDELAHDYGVKLGDVEAAIWIEAGFLEAAAA